MIPSCELNTFNNDSYKWIQRILKTSWMTYVLVLLGAVFGGGSLIRLYGNTCGLSIIDPSSWLRASITIGSTGAVTNLKTTPLMPIEDLVDALKIAQGVAYTPPTG